MPGKRNATPRGPKHKKCRTCTALIPIGALVAGDCPPCAGLVALPLRGEGGRFLSLTRPAGGATGGAGESE